jgi:LPS-assembly protein
VPAGQRNFSRFAGAVLLLTAAFCASADASWNCIGETSGGGWICRGRGQEAFPTKAQPADQTHSTKFRATSTKTTTKRSTRAIEKAPAPISEIAIFEPSRQTTWESAPAPADIRDTGIGRGPVPTLTAATAQPQEPGAAATSRSSRGGEPPAGQEGSGPGSREGAPAYIEANTEPESRVGSEHHAPEATGSKSEASVSRSADTRRLYEGLGWEYCGPRPARLGPANLPPQPGKEDRLFLSADTFDYDRELKLLWLEGNVRAAQGSRRIAADKVVYDRDSADLVAEGNIFLANPGIRIIADKAQINLDTDKGSLSDVHYRLTGRSNARGSAARAALVQPMLTRYQDIRYSTCPPGQDTWALEATELELDQASGWGWARNARLRIQGMPVFYTPYLSFPIDDRRKSGILVPTIGNSDTNGIDVTVPYYWNIAPNMDATISPRYMSTRGLMLGTELRYLSPHQEAVLYGEILPKDRELEDEGTRWAYRIEQSGRFGRRWTSAVNFNAVSDDQYLEDFGNRLQVTSIRNIERRGDLYYWGDGWHLLTRLQEFQTVDASLTPQQYPYGRLPELLFGMSPYSLDSGIQLGLGGDYNYFEHETNVHGHRAALQPYARWPLRKPYGHLIPQLSLYLAGYDLIDQIPDEDERPSYAIPSFDLDTGLVFERSVTWLQQESLQTLEPRIFYLYTPFVDQEDIPVFDTTELTFSYYSLFQRNRFAGWDRIGDANQLTLSLTSRTLAKSSGQELLHGSIGQILYFRNRDVQITGEPQDERRSSIAAVLSARLLKDWTSRASFVFDPNRDSNQSRKQALELHYQTPNDRLLNLSYRFDAGTSEETRYENTDLSFRLPVNRQLQLVGRWSYSLQNSQTVDALAGVEYGQCCWRMRIVGRHLKNKPDSDANTSLMVQIELAGLGSIGQRVDKLLERGIYGYHTE